jgi:hypothetical protein
MVFVYFKKVKRTITPDIIMKMVIDCILIIYYAYIKDLDFLESKVLTRC